MVAKKSIERCSKGQWGHWHAVKSATGKGKDWILHGNAPRYAKHHKRG